MQQCWTQTYPPFHVICAAVPLLDTTRHYSTLLDTIRHICLEQLIVITVEAVVRLVLLGADYLGLLALFFILKNPQESS